MPKKFKGKTDKGPNIPDVKAAPSKPPIRTDSEGKHILMDVYAKPGAKQNAIVDVRDEKVNVQINAPPVEGSANNELVKYIASFLGLKSSNVALERGHKSRNKVLKITGDITRDDVVKKVNAELPPESKLPD